MNELLEKLDIESTIENIKTLFYYFNGEKILFFVLFLLSVEYIWFTEKNKKVRDFFTWFICIILIVIWNPICIKILGKFINFTSMYRLYFMLPINLTIAVACTKFIEKQKNIILKILVLIVLLFSIVNFRRLYF